jgi:hypothetical protein
MRQVFEKPSVARTTPLGAAEPRVNWFLKSTRPQAVEGRRVINDMYSRFPDIGGRLRHRLRSRRDSDHLAALDELLAHELLSQHYRVEYEAATAGTRPDFLLFDGSVHVGTVEVYSLMLRGEWEDERRRHGRIEDELNHQIRPTSHFIDFDVRQWDNRSDLAHLVGWVRQTLSDLQTDPGSLPLGYQGAPQKAYEHESAEIHFHFWATPAGYTPREADRIAVGDPKIGGFVNSAHRLSRALKRKTDKYELAGKPFAIVVGVADPMCDLDDVLDALTGNQAVVIATGEGTRDDSGVYGPQKTTGRGLRRPALSAVFAVQDWFPGGPCRPRITRFDNPFAAVPFRRMPSQSTGTGARSAKTTGPCGPIG